jgi:hypothetical protein
VTAPTKPNAELAYRVLDHIDAHPEQWNQSLYIGKAECGTVACFAGWTVLLSGATPKFYGVYEGSTAAAALGGLHHVVPELAEELLGASRWVETFVDGEPDMDLFDQDNSREDLGRLVAEIFGPRPVDWDKPLTPVMGVPASGCDCSHDGGHGLSPWPDRARGHAEDCPAYRSPVDDVPPNAGSTS